MDLRLFYFQVMKSKYNNKPMKRKNNNNNTKKQKKTGIVFIQCDLIKEAKKARANRYYC